MDFNDSTYENLNEKGYVLIQDFLSREECKILKKSLIKSTFNLIFTRQGYTVNETDEESLKFLTDMKLRKSKLGEKASDIIWRDGNTRTPLISKSCGMIHIHFDEELLDTITFNERLYNKASEIMGTPYLVHSYGPERFSIKAPGATDMSPHIDANLFNDDVNYDYRIQCLATIDIDKEIRERDSGTISLLIYFHHYWYFARELFHPIRGLFPMKKDMMKTRFFLLPNNKKEKDDFNINYLPYLKKYGILYIKYLNSEKIHNDLNYFRESSYEEKKKSLDFFQKIKSKGITVPSNIKYLEDMDWVPIKMDSGDLIFWHQHLPHQSLRNKSKTKSRIAAYYSLFPVKKGWFGTSHQKWVSDQFNKCEFYHELTTSKILNIEELEMIKEEGKLKSISEKSRISQFRRRISGQESWWNEDSSDVENLCDSIMKKINNKTKYKLVFQDEYLAYIPELIQQEYFDMLLPQLKKVCKSINIQTQRRISVLYSKDNTEIPSYIETPRYDWNKAPVELLNIKKYIENYFGYNTDYVLCHIYRGLPDEGNPGSDYIGLHNDEESLNSNVISVSLGATRKFYFTEINNEKIKYDEIVLNSGDVIHMYGSRNNGLKPSCQKKFKHSVPKMTIDDLVEHIKKHNVKVPKGRKTYKNLREIIEKNNISPDRINLTFRQYEN